MCMICLHGYLLPCVDAQYGFNLVGTNFCAGIQTQDLPDHNQNVAIDALDRSAI